MRTFTTNAVNDFVVSGRSLQLSSNIDAVLLVARHCAQAILGEMVFAQAQGMPYFETVWVGAPSAAPFEAAFRDRVLRIEGVVNILELTTEQVGDRMQYQATIETIYGTGSING